MHKVIKLVFLSSVFGGCIVPAQANTEALLNKMQAQIEMLTEKVDRLEAEKRNKKVKRKASRPAPRIVSVAKETVNSPKTPAHIKPAEPTPIPTVTRSYPKGFIPVPGIKSAIKINGYAKLDAVYDAGPFTGDSSNLPALPLNHYDLEAKRKGFLRAHVRQSRLAIASITDTPLGDLSTYFEGDFFGTTNFGSNLSRADSSSSSAYNFRVRHYYALFRNFMVGQYWSNFLDINAIGETVEFNGPTGSGIIRRPQIRYIHQATPNWKLSFALENGVTEYTDETGAFKEHNAFLNNTAGDGLQRLPDVTAQLRYTSLEGRGHFSIHAMGRQLRVRKVTTPRLTKTTGGYGLGFSGRLNPIGKSGVFGQANFGKGIGTYIFDLDGQAAALDTPSRRFRSQFGYAFIAGYEHYFMDCLRSNLVYGTTRVRLAKFAPKTVPISKAYKQIFINLIYSPVSQVDLGIEYGRFERKTTLHRKGLGHRFQIGLMYRFGNQAELG